MKKLITMLLCLTLIVSLFAGCGSKDSGSTTAAPARLPASKRPRQTERRL